jgi:hypothetical protein
MLSHATTVSGETTVGLRDAFEYIVPIDLTSIFTGYGPLPSVNGVKDQTGAWDAAGQTRTVLLSDGSSAQEALTSYDHPNYFGYTVSGFTGSLGLLAHSANGAWWFSNAPTGGTLIKWSYKFNAKSALAWPILGFIAYVLWRGYMRKALRLCIAQLEDGTG